jgi:hypothetical protein
MSGRNSKDHCHIWPEDGGKDKQQDMKEKVMCGAVEVNCGYVIMLSKELVCAVFFFMAVFVRTSVCFDFVYFSRWKEVCRKCCLVRRMTSMCMIFCDLLNRNGSCCV